MSRRLKLLNGSLMKKKAKLDHLFESHFADVKSANGQPLNDKKNGISTMARWDRQEDAIRRQQGEIKKTENAIERETSKIQRSNEVKETLPDCILQLIEDGKLHQWRRHPNIFFVNGVEKARIVFKDGKIFHRYATEIPNQDQFAVFRDVYNELRQEINEG